MVDRWRAAGNKREFENSILFRGVNLESVQDLLEDCTVRSFKGNSALIKAGQPNEHLYLLLSGSLRIHLDVQLDPIVVVAPVEFAGELSLIDCQMASAYVISQDDSRLLVLDAKTV